MGSVPDVLLLDDGELDDIHQMLDELKVPVARIRGGAIVDGTPPPRNLLVSTPRRIEAVQDTLHATSEPPVRMMVVNEDSNALRKRLRSIGFDYLVRRPVHEEALRLLLLHCLYKGDERRREPRVAIGFEVSFRTGLTSRRATLADLSIRGCRLLSRTRIDPGKRIKVQIPEALEMGDPFTVPGRVVRVEGEKTDLGDTPFSLAVSFGEMSADAREALELIIEDRALGPATLRPAGTGSGRPPGSAEEVAELGPLEFEPETAEPENDPPPITSEAFESVGIPLGISVGVEVDVQGETQTLEPPKPDSPHEERRRAPRGSYTQTVPAFGNRALRVLVGRDLSIGGMRIARLPGLELGDRLHLAIYGEPGEPPVLVWGTVARDGGDKGMGLLFDPLEPEIGELLERLIGTLPAVESLHDSEIEAMGTVMSEIIT